MSEAVKDADFWDLADEGIKRPPGLDEQYHAYGEGVQMFRWLNGEVAPPREAMFEGVAGCGKTRLVAEFIKALCNQFPDSVGLVLRKTRVSLNESFLEIFENEAMGDTHPAVLTGPGRKHRDQYNHPSLGGRIVLGGMDNPVRLFSTQYHWCYVNEMQELTEEEWESLHRALRRRGLPFHPILIGDCNPEDEYHWANQRANKGMLHRIVGRFTDNPTVTQEYLSRLEQNLTGVRYQRLFLGKWVSAEGTIYDGYSTQKHLVDAQLKYIDDQECYKVISPRFKKSPVYLRWFVAGIDFGFANPGCFQVWGIDDRQRMFRVAEVYRAAWDLDQWANAIEEVWQEFPFKLIVCDSAEPRSIQFLNDRLGPTCGRDMPRIAIPAEKHGKAKGQRGKFVGFNQVRWLLKDDPETDLPRMFFLRGALRCGRDPNLEGKPGCAEEEIVSYVHPKIEAGRSVDPAKQEDADKRCADHAMDVMRYVATYVWKKDLGSRIQEKSEFGENTYGELFGDAKSLYKEELKRRNRMDLSWIPEVNGFKPPRWGP